MKEVEDGGVEKKTSLISGVNDQFNSVCLYWYLRCVCVCVLHVRSEDTESL